MTSRAPRVAVLTVAILLAIVGCARFDEAATSPFSPEPSYNRGAEVDPHDPSLSPTTTTPTTAPSGPCIDPDPNVVATCLDTTGGLVTLPDGASALVSERRTGRILQVTQGRPPLEIAAIPVDGSGDGGLLDLALSPTFAEDGLIYAYITTGTDNRVVRIAQRDVPKDILVGIPRGASGNRGAIEFDGDRMLILTGDTGNPAAAADPASLAGKLLRVDRPVPGATPPPEVVLSGIGGAGDVCTDGSGTIWVTDRTVVEDRLQRVGADGSVVSPAWTWPERPGVAGCAAGSDLIAVALTDAKAVAVASVDPQTGAVTAAPTLIAQDRYGRLSGASAAIDGTLWSDTVNKETDSPGPNDDRVVRIPIPEQGGGGID